MLPLQHVPKFTEYWGWARFSSVKSCRCVLKHSLCTVCSVDTDIELTQVPTTHGMEEGPQALTEHCPVYLLQSNFWPQRFVDFILGELFCSSRSINSRTCGRTAHWKTLFPGDMFAVVFYFLNGFVLCGSDLTSFSLNVIDWILWINYRKIR